MIGPLTAAPPPFATLADAAAAEWSAGAPLGVAVNVGGSPGDEGHPLPYLYVGPWSVDADDDVPVKDVGVVGRGAGFRRRRCRRR